MTEKVAERFLILLESELLDIFDMWVTDVTATDPDHAWSGKDYFECFVKYHDQLTATRRYTSLQKFIDETPSTEEDYLVLQLPHELENVFG